MQRNIPHRKSWLQLHLLLKKKNSKPTRQCIRKSRVIPASHQKDETSEKAGTGKARLCRAAKQSRDWRWRRWWIFLGAAKKRAWEITVARTKKDTVWHQEFFKFFKSGAGWHWYSAFKTKNKKKEEKKQSWKDNILGTSYQLFTGTTGFPKLHSNWDGAQCSPAGGFERPRLPLQCGWPAVWNQHKRHPQDLLVQPPPLCKAVSSFLFFLP